MTKLIVVVRFEMTQFSVLESIGFPKNRFSLVQNKRTKLKCLTFRTLDLQRQYMKRLYLGRRFHCGF